MTCRWGAGCDLDAGSGIWGKFCPKHAATLAKIRVRYDGGHDTIADALLIAHVVLGAGALTRAQLEPAVVHLTTHQRAKAIEVAQAQRWIAKGTPLRAGASLPPGLSAELQALVLAQDVAEGNDPPAEINGAVLAVAVDRG